MADRPIIFDGPKVRAILEGSKTQERIILKNFPKKKGLQWYQPFPGSNQWHGMGRDRLIHAYYDAPYAIGDRLWVRETWACIGKSKATAGNYVGPISLIRYRATELGAPFDRAWKRGHAKGYDGSCYDVKPLRWRSAVTMPRWASRITLRVTDVRVQRLQDISEEDAEAEGCAGWYSPSHHDHGVTDGRLPHEEFSDLWDNLNAKRGYPWDSNPWVVAITFEREE